MIQKIFSLTTSVLLSTFIIAQSNQSTTVVDWAWTNVYGNQANSVANHVVVDDSLNLYVSGTFSGTMIVENDTIYAPVNDNRVFVSRFDQYGNLDWIRRIDWGNYVNMIRLGADNDLYVLCNSNTMIVYDGFSGQPVTYYNLPNPSGNTQVVQDFEIDASNNMYVVTQLEDNTNWVAYCNVSAYSVSGGSISTTLWAKDFAIGTAPLDGIVRSIALDTNNNVYISGTSSGYQLDLSGGTITGTPGAPGYHLFAAKYDAQGDALWLDTLPTFYTEQFGLEVNTMDNSLYMTGYQITNEIFYTDTLAMDTTNQQQIYLVKYDLDGNYNWSKAFPLATKTQKTYPNASWGASGTHLSLTDSGYVYLKGIFTGSIIFESDTLVEDTTTVVLGSIADDVFIAKLDPNGNPLWGKYAGNSGGIGYETGGFWIDSENDIMYLVGYYTDSNNVNKSSMSPTSSVKNIFIGREGEPNVASFSEIPYSGNTLLVYPNPSSGVYYVSKTSQTGNIRYQILDIRGNIMTAGTLKANKEAIDLSEFAPGMYFLTTDQGSVKLLKE